MFPHKSRGPSILDLNSRGKRSTLLTQKSTKLRGDYSPEINVQSEHLELVGERTASRSVGLSFFYNHCINRWASQQRVGGQLSCISLTHACIFATHRKLCLYTKCLTVRVKHRIHDTLGAFPLPQALGSFASVSPPRQTPPSSRV